MTQVSVQSPRPVPFIQETGLRWREAAHDRKRRKDRKFLFCGSDIESHMAKRRSRHTSCHFTSNTQTICLLPLHSHLILSRHVSVFTVALLSLTSCWTQFIFGWRPCPVSIQTSCAAVDPVQLAPARCYFGNN